MAARHTLTAQQELVIGIALTVAGAWLLHQYWEGRGRARPFAARFLP